MDRARLNEVRNALRLIYEGERRLRELNVLLCNKPLDSQYGEWIVAEVEGGRVADSGSQAGWDVKLSDESTISVKTDRKASTNNCRGEFGVPKSQIDRLRDSDFVVCIQFGEDRTVEGYYKVPVGQVRSLPIERLTDGKEGYRLRPLLRGAIRLPDDLMVPITDNMLHLVPVTVNDAAHAELVAIAERGEYPTVEDAVRAIILNALFGPIEYGDLTNEEQEGSMQTALKREDLWGSREDDIWDRWEPSKLATS